MVKLIALDLDGTLLHKDGTVSEENQFWIQSAMKSGVQVTLATGRHRNGSVQELRSLLGLNAPMVTSNGSEVWLASEKDVQFLARHTLSHAQIRQLLSDGQETGATCWAATVDGPLGQEEFPEHPEETEWLKFGFYSEETEVIETLWHRLRERDLYELTNSHVLNIEINPKGVSKASGLSLVCERLGIAPDEVAVMGDSLNDVAMIQWAGCGIAMGNAQDAVKAVAKWVTAPHDEHGVARAIQRLLSQ